MNKEKLRKALYDRVRLRPVAKILNAPNELVDDDWIIIDTNDKLRIRLKNIRTDLSPWIGYDQIHNYTSDPNRNFDGLNHGFLNLTVQILIHGENYDLEPIRLDEQE